MKEFLLSALSGALFGAITTLVSWLVVIVCYKDKFVEEE